MTTPPDLLTFRFGRAVAIVVIKVIYAGTHSNFAMRHKQINKPIIVIVAPSATGENRRITGYAADDIARHPCEGAGAGVVVEKVVLSGTQPVDKEEIQIAVIVIVSPRAANRTCAFRDNAARSDLREGAAAEIQVEPIGGGITRHRHKQVRSSVVVVVSPSGVEAVLRGGADKVVGDAREASVSVIVIKPVDSRPCHEHIQNSVIVVVGPHRSVRRATASGNDAADGFGRQPRERTVTIVPIKNRLCGIVIPTHGEKIEVTVVIKIRPRAAAPIPDVIGDGARDHPGEGPVAVVVIEKILLPAAAEVGDEQIKKAIVIV